MKRHLVMFVSTTILFLGITLPVFADMISISGLYDTGVNDAGKALATGDVETHYILSSVSPLASGITTVVPYASGAWLPPPPESNWIGPQAHAAGLSSDPEGAYSYKLNFSLTGLNPNSASISGKWAADNSAELLLNGKSMATVGGFGSLESFLLTGPNFINGINTLEFKVTNYSGDYYWGNPSGLLVSGLQGTASSVPLPPSVWLLGSSLIGLVGFRRFKKI
ncbi:MAG: VPLPA-CTERM sorting domain-containing protein [Proteobacteria bacterium]|nr:VPLPA-CTERM sorting domain-containing protein [Pseudomonadota bacterium]